MIKVSVEFSPTTLLVQQGHWEQLHLLSLCLCWFKVLPTGAAAALCSSCEKVSLLCKLSKCLRKANLPEMFVNVSEQLLTQLNIIFLLTFTHF